jgi:hypothetical protein
LLKIAVIRGQPVVDPMPGGSQAAFIYPEASDRYRTDGKIANPNNYLIVPDKFSEQQARDYADRIYQTQKIPFIGICLAQARMGLDFAPGGSQDLQRDPQWGIPPDSLVPAYISSASHYLGFVSGLTNTPLDLVETAGGHTNRGKDKTGPHGVSQQNHANLVKGYADATALLKPEWLTNNFGYRSQSQTPASQIGEGQGVANWGTSQGDIKPAYPVQQNSASGDGTGRLPGFFSGKPAPDRSVPPPIYGTR